MTGATQITGGTTYPFSYPTPINGSGYNLIDGVMPMTMPSGRTSTTNYDPIGRPNGLGGSCGTANTSHITSVSNAPQGAPTQLTPENTLSEQTCFNEMLQPPAIRQPPTGNVAARSPRNCST